MTIEEQYASVKQAVQEHKLKQLMLGQGEYSWGDLKHIPADVPCDISAVLKYGLYRLHCEAVPWIPQQLTSVIVELSMGTPVEVWTAYSIMWYQYRNELTDLSPFKIITPVLLNTVSTSINRNRDALAQCKEYVGKYCKFGLLEDIVVSNQSLQKKFEVSIL